MSQSRLPVIDYRATGNNIRELRLQNHYSVFQLQEIFGFSNPQSIYKWERGINLPDIENLMALSQLYHVRMENILITKDEDVSFIFLSAGPMECLPALVMLFPFLADPCHE